MCGIIGYVGDRANSLLLYNGLKRLEYRGYDSSGIATQVGTTVSIVRAEGKLINLEKKLHLLPSSLTTGMGHTRWATHGKPTELNAHPHRSGSIILLHNGIIENYTSLKRSVLEKGYEISSETDTEIAAHLLNYNYTLLKRHDSLSDKRQLIKEAILSLVTSLEGTFAFGIMCADIPDEVYCVKYGSPLIIGLGKKENYFASGINALVEHTNRMIIMEDREIALLSKEKVEIFSFSGQQISREAIEVSWTSSMLEKNGYQHFMLKEIHEEPRAVSQALTNKIDIKNKMIRNSVGNINLREIDRIQIVSCGTSFYAGLLARYYIEKFAKIPIEVELASELRYRHATINASTLSIAVSQSGETIDTLQSIKHLKKHGAKTLALVNVPNSSIGHECDSESITFAGPEVGVASTKAFMAQACCLLTLGLEVAQSKQSMPRENISSYIDDLFKIPSLLDRTLSLSQKIESLASKYSRSKNLLFIGRGPQWAIASEGALKLKEITYIHAEAYAAGELKHGPIALINENMTVVCLAPKDDYHDKTISNIEEIRARGGKILSIGDEGDEALKGISDDFIGIASAPTLAQPFITALILHLFAYWAAVTKGTDVDQPRNLAKSVTVE